ncbi:MAG: L-2-amino-thiazoline-4-carboxylic acid hydrolase [Chloroflexota bacterium]
MDAETPTQHKFQEDSHMTYEEVFDFAYKGLVPVLQGLAKELGEERFWEALKKTAFDAKLKEAQDYASQLPSNDLDAYSASAREPSRFARHILTVEFIEDTPQAAEIKVTECLWAKTFRELGAAEIGYMLTCGTDDAHCQGFNPRIRMIHSKTLMQGDEYCNHRFVWEE